MFIMILLMRILKLILNMDISGSIFKDDYSTYAEWINFFGFGYFHYYDMTGW